LLFADLNFIPQGREFSLKLLEISELSLPPDSFVDYTVQILFYVFLISLSDTQGFGLKEKMNSLNRYWLSPVLEEIVA
jgi:hypothetical protein